VVLDEPNANLDAEGEAGLLQALADLREGGVTVVMTTHKPSLLSGMDKVLVMRDGQMEMFGQREQVLARVAPGATARNKADSAAL
jgi:ABC-type protease/lipase transport system fused ATPase/permease subunit